MKNLWPPWLLPLYIIVCAKQNCFDFHGVRSDEVFVASFEVLIYSRRHKSSPKTINQPTNRWRIRLATIRFDCYYTYHKSVLKGKLLSNKNENINLLYLFNPCSHPLILRWNQPLGKNPYLQYFLMTLQNKWPSITLSSRNPVKTNPEKIQLFFSFFFS